MSFASIPWGQTRRVLAGSAAALAILGSATACGHQGTTGEERTESTEVRATDEASVRRVDLPLDTAMKAAADQGKGFSLRDATSLGRYISPAYASRFKACFERQKPNLKAVDFFVVRRSEKCPLRVGDDMPPGTTPKVLGVTLRKAVHQLVEAGFAPDHISVDTLDAKGHKTNERHWSWEVCTQNPTAGTPFSAALKPKLVVKASCSGN
ncbi:hypothetical protein ACIBU0_28275 [Streptomyces sp. NPDC049627]|uniref:hypothetical protein n=1 Tax=Streptomyces sp. NPDC049627 TaxID=3365595 RepID=UPI003788EC7D